MMIASAKEKKYIEAVGRRKTSIARVRLTQNVRDQITVNDKDISEYFSTPDLVQIVRDSLVKAKDSVKHSVIAKVRGGGIHSQAEALRHGISRAISKNNPEIRKTLKKLGYLKRDPRAKERRKFGLKKARKAPQWSKR